MAASIDDAHGLVFAVRAERKDVFAGLEFRALDPTPSAAATHVELSRFGCPGRLLINGVDELCVKLRL